MTLDPFLAQVLAAGAGQPDYTRLTAPAARAAMRAQIGPLLAQAPPPPPIEHLACPGPAGEIALRLIRPDGARPLPVVVFLHGGGWVLCDLDTHQPLAAALARGSGAAVLMVDYRLAPEHRFPAAIDDASAALAWLRDNGARLGLDPARIVVAGDSAGGNLAAALARRERDAGRPLAGQYLIYPVTDLPDAQAYPSYAENDRDYGLSRAAMLWYWQQYAGTTASHPDAVPMRADDVARLAPALIQTAQYDVLRDEGEAYAARFAAAGVAVSLARHAGMIHGFLAFDGMLGGATRAVAQGCDWLRARFA